MTYNIHCTCFGENGICQVGVKQKVLSKGRNLMGVWIEVMGKMVNKRMGFCRRNQFQTLFIEKLMEVERKTVRK